MIKPLLFTILLSLTFCFSTNAQSILINEVMTSNSNAYLDEFGDTPDWIEIFNSSNQSINLNNFSISDDPLNLQKWEFPNYVLDGKEFALIAASGKNIINASPSWETIIDVGEIWKYRLGQSEPPTDWKEIGFNDETWQQGPTGIGYGDNDDSTVIPFVNSLYLRKTFAISNKEIISQIMLSIDYDDGYVAYLNGIEISRSNLGNIGEFISFNRLANSVSEAKLYQNLNIETVFLDSIDNVLVEGLNVLAIQVHNASSVSSDLSAIPFLTLGYNQSFGQNYIAPEIKDLLPKLHTNFSVSNGNESIYLTENSGQFVDSVGKVNLIEDVSFGRKPDGSNNWVFFDEPTPGSSNNALGFSGVIKMPELNFPPGSYNSPISVDLLNPTTGVTTYYTLDGSDPTENSSLFNTPLIISNTVVLKLKSFKDGVIPSQTNTLTYFIDGPNNLPIVSISTDPKNLWDYNTGIYVMGPNAEPNFPFFGANFWQDWEKPAHIEILESTNSRVVSQDASIKIFGAWSRGNDQKSLAVFPLKKIEYKIFPELSINNFKSLVLRNSGNDWNSTMLRDGFISTLANPLNIDNLAYRPAELYLNGEYWGIQNIREKLNLNYIASHYDVKKDEIDLLENGGDIIDGTNIEYFQLINYITTRDLSNTEYYKNVETQIDIDSFIDYQLLEIYIANTDWPGNNNKFWKERNERGKWRWILFDTDFSYSWIYGADYTHNTLEFALEENGPDWPNPPWSTFLMRKLIENDSFKRKFINRYCDLANTELRSENVKNLLSAIADKIEPSIQRHLERWGQFSYGQWIENINTMKKFADFRIALLHSFFIDKFDLGTNKYLEFDLSKPASGKIQINSITPDFYPWKGNYFSGTIIQLIAKPNPGYEFTGWSGGSNSNKDTLEIEVGSWSDIKANFSKKQDYPQIVINEINYNSISTHDTKDWIELYNISDSIVNLNSWVLKDESDSNVFTFPSNVFLGINEYLIVSRDTASFSLFEKGNYKVLGDFNFGLNNSGDLVRLYNSEEILIDSVRYDDNPPWPNDPDGSGTTLELINPELDNSIASNWKSSIDFGTPGFRNSIFIVEIKNEELKLNKFNLEQNYPNPFNPSTTISYTIPSHSVISKPNDMNEEKYYGTKISHFDMNNNITLKIYNVLGQEVTTLVNQKQKPGKYSVKFNGSKLTSGIYFYKLSVGQNQFIKKMILLK